MIKHVLHTDKSFGVSALAGRRQLISRERLLALDQGLPILVIEAPSGYGKTVLAEMWLNVRPVGVLRSWISLDGASRDPALFLNQLQDAVGAAIPAYDEAGMDGEAGLAGHFAYLCAHLVDDDARYDLVVDDVHLIADSPSRAYLEKLLALASARLRICLTMQPFKLDLGLGRMTGQGRVAWIDAKSLALTRDEVAQLAELHGQELSAAQQDWLYGATGGWPALTHLALTVPLEVSDSINPRDVVGSAPIREYIYERFVGGLSENDREVLWVFACLGSVPIQLLSSLKLPETDVALAIQRLRALGIVQNRDPDDSSVLCLHALIREGVTRLLDPRLQRDRVELLREAADWYWRNDQGATAVRLALEAGQPLESLARDWLVALGFQFLFRTGQHQTLLDLIERWERSSSRTDAEVDSIAAWALIFQRQFAAAEPRLARVETASASMIRETLQLQRAVMAALRDNVVTGGAIAKDWIAAHQSSHSFPMGVAATVYAFSLKFTGEYDHAADALRDATQYFSAAQSAYGAGWVHVVGAIVQAQAGRYRAALAQIEGGLAHCPSLQGFGSLRTMLRAIEAFLRYERNELDRVREIISEILPLLAAQGAVDPVNLGYTAAARERAVHGDFGTALDILSEGEMIAVQRDFPRLSLILRSERASLLVRSGAINQARPIINALPAPPPFRTTNELLRARVTLADGDGRRARELLGPVLEKNRRSGRQSRLCEVLLNLAAAEDLCGNDEAAYMFLAEALEIGAAEGLVRTFLDEGKAVSELIARWIEQAHPAAQSAKALALRLKELAKGPTVVASPDPLVSRFNRRERQILALLSEGLSNAQLAQRCFISEGTVKWYLHNLYEKLDVSNRTALVRAVRERGLTP